MNVDIGGCFESFQGSQISKWVPKVRFETPNSKAWRTCDSSLGVDGLSWWVDWAASMAMKVDWALLCGMLGGEAWRHAPTSESYKHQSLFSEATPIVSQGSSV